MRTFELAKLIWLSTPFASEGDTGPVRLAVHIGNESVAALQCSIAVKENYKPCKPRHRCLGHPQPVQQSCLATCRCRGERALQPRDVLGVDGVEPNACERPRLVKLDEPSLCSRLVVRPGRCLSPPGLLAVRPPARTSGRCPGRSTQPSSESPAGCPTYNGRSAFSSCGIFHDSPKVLWATHRRNPLQLKTLRGFLGLPFTRAVSPNKGPQNHGRHP